MGDRLYAVRAIRAALRPGAHPKQLAVTARITRLAERESGAAARCRESGAAARCRHAAYSFTPPMFTPLAKYF